MEHRYINTIERLIMQFTWHKEYNIGVKELDLHHRRILTLINMLYNASKSGTEEKKFPYIIQKLEEYAEYHFAYEESLFENTCYKDCAFHKDVHKNFRAQLQNIKSAVDSNHILDALQLMEFLTSWFVNHILKTDQGITPYIKTSNDETKQ